MDVSVCIVNWNTRALLRDCLRSIAAWTQGVAVEVIVVDNASTDGSVAMLRRAFPEVRLIASEDNLGFARGSNLAASVATGDYLLYLNPDTELRSNAIRGLRDFLATHPGHGAAGCRLLNTDGSLQATCASDLPSPRNELASLLLLDRLFPASRWCAARELNHWDHADSRDVACLSGACMMLPRPLAQALGGFDERHFMYGEDLDLCCRLRATGARLHYLAGETIVHHEGAASRKRGRGFAPLRQRAANYDVLRRNCGRRAALGYRAAVALGAGARVLGGALALPLWSARDRASRPDLPDFVVRHAELVLWSLGLKKAGRR